MKQWLRLQVTEVNIRPGKFVFFLKQNTAQSQMIILSLNADWNSPGMRRTHALSLPIALLYCSILL